MINLSEQAPFDESDRAALSKMLGSWSEPQCQWLAGFLAGLSAGTGSTQRAGSGGGSLLVLYGTESGNSEELAARTTKAAKGAGFRSKVVNMADSKPEDLAEADNLLVVVSTWGEGDPPESAVEYYRAFMAGSFDLKGVRYSVCALGDTSYEHFCQVGKDFDQQLEKLGAERAYSRADCDVDFEETYSGWVEGALAALGGGGAGVVPGGSVAAPPAPAVEYGKKNPFPSTLLEKVLLSGPGSRKETWHFELSLDGSGLSYDVGDALAVVPTNAADVVEALLEAGGLDGDEEVETKSSGRKSLREALANDYDITALSRKVAKTWQAYSGSGPLAELLDDDHKEQFKDWTWGRQIVDLVREFPAGKTDPHELLTMLRPLPPRLYSIASSPREHEGEVHLTVAAVRYEGAGHERKGVASTCLADLVEVGDVIPVFVTPNKRFRLPEDAAVPIIMVGPGTGVAPFRAFVEDRATREGAGSSWLIFGDQCYTYDFLYQLEWQDHLKSGALTRLDVAFSRDQPEKVYVQDRIREHGEDIWKWLEDGAHFYVCGDASRMAPDVHAVLLEVVAEHGGRSAEEAETYMADLKKSGRYQRDVY